MPVRDLDVEVRLLGPLQLWINGEDRAPAGRIRRTIIGLLALEAGRRLDPGTLIDRVWNGSSPPTAKASLQMHLSHLRKTAGLDDVLVTVPGGYRLEIDEESVDALRFTAAVREGRDHLAARRFSRSIAVLSAALKEWSDPPVPDLAHLEAAQAHVTELTILHQEAEIDLATARLEVDGRAPDLAELERLAELYPLDERAWRLLMVAYYRTGRQADALSAFRRASEVLGAELGIEPGQELRETEGLILERDPSLEPRAPQEIAIPAFTTPFLGRDESVRLLSKAILEQRLITLVGMGGVGKTRLAVETVRRSAGGFADGAFFVRFESIDDEDLVPGVIVDALSCEGADPATSLREVIGDRDILVVLDNCEHLVESVAAEVAGLLRSCVGLTILATSRTPLRVRGEMTWPVTPLDLPRAEDSIADLQQVESVRFFTEAARRVNRDFALTNANASSVSSLCRDLAGIPLALELAASSCDVLTPRDVHERLTGTSGLSERAEHGRPSRHHSLDDMVTWSLELLEATDRRLFERMAVFAGPVDRDALAAVCVEEDERLVEATVRRLAHSSLVTVDLTGAKAAYGQLPPLKQAAARRIHAEDWQGLERDHARYFLDLANSESGEAGSATERAWFEDVEAAIAEIRAALDFVRDHDPLEGLRAATKLAPYWHSRNKIVEGRHHISVLRARAAVAELGDIAAALKAEGTLAFAMSDLFEADRLLSEALDTYSRLDDRAQMAATLNNLGVIAVDTGDLGSALDRYTRARTIFEDVDDRNGLAATSLNLGVVELQRGNSESARTWFERALDEFRRIDNRTEEAHAMARLAYVAHFEGDIHTARTWIHAARGLYAEMGMTDAVARADWLLADVARAASEMDAASALAAHAAMSAMAQHHHAWWMPGLLETSAQIAAARLDQTLAARLVGAAASFRRRTGISKPAMAVAHYEAFVDDLREQMGADYAPALAAGESLSLEQALSLVDEELGSRKPTDTGVD
jgi:predicted ATPase/DNA-binding SARP family transcriptional activator